MPPTNALGNWYANLIYVGRAQMVMATSERSLLTVLLPAADLRKALVANLGELTYLLLQEIGINPDRAAREVDAMQSALIARTESRSVLASMNDFALAARLVLAGRSVSHGNHAALFGNAEIGAHYGGKAIWESRESHEDVVARLGTLIQSAVP